MRIGFSLLEAWVLLVIVAGAAEDLAGQGVSHFAGVDHGYAVDQHVLHADGKLIWAFERRSIGYGVGVEYDDIGPQAGFEDSAVSKPHFLGGQGREFSNGVFEGQFLFLANVLSENSRKGSISSRVRVLDPEQSIGRCSLRVVADRHPRLPERESDIGLIHSEDSYVCVGMIFNQQVADGID